MEPRVNALVPYIGMSAFFYYFKRGVYVMGEKMIKVQFPDGQQKEYPQGITVESVAGSISSSLRKKAVAGKLDEATG